MKVETVQSDLFDVVLEDAVKRFQRRHGLDDDGVVGRDTLAALNVSVEDRARQIELNLERWRWLPRDLGRRHILVNIAGFELAVVEDDQLALEMRVVVGRPYRRTPVFSAPMTYLVFSPYWHVPPSLALQDVVPAVLKDPDYLTKKNIKVFRGWGAETREIDPATIDWSSVNTRNFLFRFRQEPGVNNSLGAVKFMFPNPFNVYLHDTPSRELFQKAERTFSSGCIRIAKPLELAAYLLRGAPGWSAEGIEAAAQKGVEQTVRLPEPIPVHLLYWTSWIDPDGSLQFRNDVYGRDRLLDEALREKPPTIH
jgi:murein L,D-transpeptidase YcbB/YkuD